MGSLKLCPKCICSHDLFLRRELLISIHIAFSSIPWTVLFNKSFKLSFTYSLWGFARCSVHFQNWLFIVELQKCKYSWTSPRHLYCQCNNFHRKKTLVNLFRISFFLLIVKDHQHENLGYVEKIMPCFSSSSSSMTIKHLLIKIQDCTYQRMKNTLERSFSDTYLIFFIKSNMKKKTSAFFHRKMVGLANFGLDRCVCIDNVMSFINKYMSNVFMIIFDELLKGTTLLITNSQTPV